MSLIEYLLKDDNNKTIGAVINISGQRKYINIQDIIRNDMRFENATVCSNGVIRGKNCKLNIRKQNEHYKNSMILYHGSPNKIIVPQYGLGQDKHDYGKGFYLTEYKELAKEWAISNSNNVGYLHTFELNMTGLKVFNFNNVNALHWLAELMSHREADDSIRYKRNSKIFIDKYKIDLSGYDVIYGWRADSSYFRIAKSFVKDEIDYTLLPKLLELGELNNQVCIKSRRAFNNIKSIGKPEEVNIEYGAKYKERDKRARKRMIEIIESSENTMEYTFSYVIKHNVDL